MSKWLEYMTCNVQVSTHTVIPYARLSTTANGAWEYGLGLIVDGVDIGCGSKNLTAGYVTYAKGPEFDLD